MQATATFNSPKATSYFRQMTQHFGHKIPVTVEGDQAQLEFSCGTGRLQIIDDILQLTAEAPNSTGIQETCSVLENHLLRFAFREDPKPLTWR